MSYSGIFLDDVHDCRQRVTLTYTLLLGVALLGGRRCPRSDDSSTVFRCNSADEERRICPILLLHFIWVRSDAPKATVLQF